MNKISVIIPTLYKTNIIVETIKKLCDINLVSEVIVIENCNNPYDLISHEKVKYINFEKNLFVNPSWNLGVALSENNFVLLLNDDISTDFESLINSVIESNILEYGGLVGLSEECFDNNMISSGPPRIRRTDFRGYGYGCIMFINKKYYSPIPECLKILWGDQWIFINTQRQNFEIYNLDTNKIVGITSSLPEFSSLCDDDSKNWLELISKIV
jgi:hypothetical protein